MFSRRSKIAGAAALGLGLATAAPHALAAEAADAGRFVAVDTIWVLLGAALVFFMQPGFAMVETGLTRAKNAGNIVMKNVMDFALGTVVFWVIGFGLMFGDDISGIIGAPDFFIQIWQVADDAGYPPMASSSRRSSARRRRRSSPARWQSARSSPLTAFTASSSA